MSRHAPRVPPVTVGRPSEQTQPLAEPALDFGWNPGLDQIQAVTPCRSQNLRLEGVDRVHLSTGTAPRRQPKVSFGCQAQKTSPGQARCSVRHLADKEKRIVKPRKRVIESHARVHPLYGFKVSNRGVPNRQAILR